MSWWSCPQCRRVMDHHGAAEIVTRPIVKPRDGGVDQFSIGTTRMTCPDHPGLWLKPASRPTADERARHADI